MMVYMLHLHAEHAHSVHSVPGRRDVNTSQAAWCLALLLPQSPAPEEWLETMSMKNFTGWMVGGWVGLCLPLPLLLPLLLLPDAFLLLLLLLPHLSAPRYQHFTHCRATCPCPCRPCLPAMCSTLAVYPTQLSTP